MLSYIDEGRKQDDTSEINKWIAEEMSLIALWYSELLKDYYSKLNKSIVQENRPVRIEVHDPNEDFGTSLGRGIGKGVTDAIIENRESQRTSVELGHTFMKNHMHSIVNALGYAFTLAQNDESTEKNIAQTINTVVDTIAISPLARREFSKLVQPLTLRILLNYPDIKIYKTAEPEKVACPNCGFQSAETVDDRSCSYIAFMTVVTLGFYLFFLFIQVVLYGLFDLASQSGGIANAKLGQALKCKICRHEWRHSA